MESYFGAAAGLVRSQNKALRSLETIKPQSGGVPYALLGTAIDYRIRFYFQDAINQRLVAQQGAALLASEGGTLDLGNVSFVDFEPSVTVEAGQIIDTDPSHGFPVSAGLEVFAIISDGPPPVAIPDVQGLLFDTGRLAIERVGLVVGAVTFEPVEPGSSDVGRILAQTPPPNLEVPAGTPVDVAVGESTDLSPGQTPSHWGAGSDPWVEIPDLSADRPRLDSVEIPDLVGRHWDPLRVSAELRELTLGVVAVGVKADEYAQGTIIAQAPAAGSLHRGGITVTVEVAGLYG